MAEWDFLNKSLKQAQKISKGEYNLQKMSKELLETDTFKEVNDYNASEENLRNCEPFEHLNQKFISLHEKYHNSFDEMYKHVETVSYRKEYAQGGAGMHRGFYSPSMLDLVVVGAKRGRLLKNPPKGGKDIYEYLFDSKGRMLCARFHCNYTDTHRTPLTELFLYEQNRVLSFVFAYTDWNGYQIESISECQYENSKLLRYEIAHCSALNYIKFMPHSKQNCCFIQGETFEYIEDFMQSFSWYEYIPSGNFLWQNKYTFTRDSEGFLSTYKQKQIGGYKPKHYLSNEETIHPVLVKRK